MGVASHLPRFRTGCLEQGGLPAAGGEATVYRQHDTSDEPPILAGLWSHTSEGLGGQYSELSEPEDDLRGRSELRRESVTQVDNL